MHNYLNIKHAIYISCTVALAVSTITLAAATELSHPIAEKYRTHQKNWPAAILQPGVVYQPLQALSGLPPEPINNPITEAKKTLGKHLFFDRRLSQSQQIACSSCHDPDLGWADGRRTAIGHNRQQGLINSPTVVNSGWLTDIFWDGRAQSLEEQVVASWTNPIEMAADTQAVVSALQKTKNYPILFENAFGEKRITVENTAKAIATFMRTLNLTNTPFDQFMRGDRQALNDEEIHGLHLFRTKAGCINCHHGSQLSDGLYHHLGTSFHTVGNFEGRYKLTQKARDVGAFRTPTLRGAAATAPFMHNGFVTDLDTLLSLYNLGWWQNAELKNKGNDIPTARLSSLIKPLHLEKHELMALKSFLLSLNGTMPWMELPAELP